MSPVDLSDMDGSTALETMLARFKDPRGQARISFGLDRIRIALDRLGDPQNLIPPAIHIAGTNGKGSVASFLRFMAQACDLSAHVFTSPHLVRVNERIRIAGRLVGDVELAEALAAVYKAHDDLTYFEGLTAAGYRLFARYPADFSVIETGAGGLLDSTNVMKMPAVTLFTHISKDHERMFGTSDIAEIARTKAGIMRSGVPAVVAYQDEPAYSVLLSEAAHIGAPVYAMGRDFDAHWDGDAFVFEDEQGVIRTPWLGLAGAYQLHNAAAACAAMRLLKLSHLDAQDMAAGLREAHWPGRLQTLEEGPLTRGLDARIVIDGAHNPEAARWLGEALDREKEDYGNPPAIVFAIQASKDAAAMLRHIAPRAGYFVTCPLPSAGQEGGGGADPHELSLIAEDLGVHTSAAPSVEDAFKLVAASGAKTIYVCGSLYLSGAVLRMNDQIVD